MKYTSEDTNLNDFLYCCDVIGERPSKVVLAFNFKPKEFMEFFSPKIEKIANQLVEVSPHIEGSIVNKKYLCKINKNLYMSYTHMDSTVENSYISNVIFYFSNDSESIDSFLSEMDNFIYDVEDTVFKVTYATTNQSNAVEFKPLNMMNIDIENINMYYNDDVMKSTKKLIKAINKNNKGLSIIHGIKGSGKTSLLHYIANEVERDVLFIPISMIDVTINNPSFKNLGIEESLIIIDDCEFFNDNYLKNNITYANILQMIDGFYSDNLNVNILLSFNIEEEDEINDELIESNNLLDIIKVTELTKGKSNKLLTHLDFDSHVNDNMLLINIINNDIENKSIKIGYE